MTTNGQFYEWFYVNTNGNSTSFADDIQHRLESKYYQKIHELYDKEQLFVPAVIVKTKEKTIVINVAEMQRIVEENRKFSMFPIYRVPKFQVGESARPLKIQDLGKSDRWIVKGQADSFVLDESSYAQSLRDVVVTSATKKPEYRAFKVHSIRGSKPNIQVSSMQLMPYLPLVVANIGRNSFGRNWELPQIMFTAHSKTSGRLIGLHIQITEDMESGSRMNFGALKGKEVEFEFRPNTDTKIVRKGSFEYLCLEGKMVQSQADVCMVVGVHVFNAEN